MAVYMRVLGAFLCAAGIVASVLCYQAMTEDEDYYNALRAIEKYPGNVLYTTELKMAEPRHMLLAAGAASAAPVGLVLGSICLGIGSLLAAGRSRQG